MQYKNNKKGVKLLAAVMVFAMAFAGCAFVLSDSGDVDAADDITYISGTITAGTGYGSSDLNDQVYKTGKVVVNGDLTIPKYAKLTIEGAEFTVNKDSTITIQAGGQLEIKSGLVKVNGNIVADGTDSEVTAPDFKGAIVNTSNTLTDVAGVFVYGKIALNKGATLTDGNDDTTISGTIAVLAGGSIEVNKKNSVVSAIHDQNILIAENVTLTLSGFATDVTVSAYTGSDKFYQTSTIAINNTVIGSADAKKTSSIVIKTVVEKNQAIYGTFSGSTFTAGDSENAVKVTMKNYVMDVSGTIRGGDLVQISDGVNAYNNDKAGDYYLLDKSGKPVKSEIISPIATISGDLVVDELGKITVDENTILDVSGKVTVGYDKDLAGGTSKNRIAIKGDIIISGNVTFNWDVLATYLSGKVTVDGGLLTVPDYKETDNKVGGLYSAYYIVDDIVTGKSTTYFCDLKVAIEGAVASGVDEVVVYAGATSESATTIEMAIERNAYIVPDGLVIPDGMTLRAMNALYVPEGVTLTFDVGSEFDKSTWGSKYIFIDGKVVDNDRVLSANNLFFEVSKYNEDTDVTVFTTLAIAISEASAGEVIELASNVDVKKTLTVPADVTVDINGKNLNIYPKGEVIVDGVLDVSTGKIYVATQDNDVGKVTVKNILVDATSSNVLGATWNGSVFTTTSAAFNVSGIYASGTIGDDTTTKYYILAPAVAAENSKTLGSMTIKAKTTYSGDLVFTAKDDTTETLTINAETIFGKVTLSGYTISIVDGPVTATIGADVTSGYSAVKLDKVDNALSIAIIPQDSGEEITTTFSISNGGTDITLAGNMTIAEGDVYMSDNMSVGDIDGKDKYVLNIAAGANLIVKNKTLTVVEKDLDGAKNYSGLVVDGTLTIDKGDLVVEDIDAKDTAGMATINGTLAISKKVQTIEGTLVILGTLDIDNTEKNGASVSVSAKAEMIVGKAPETLGSAPTVIGALNILGSLIVYPGADMSGALINIDEGTGESSAYKIDLIVDGDIYMTGYTTDGNASVNSFIPESISIPGFEPIMKNTERVATWFVDEKFNTKVDTQKVADYSAAYAKVTPSSAYVQISVGTGMSLWIDGVKYNTGDVKEFNVGEYDVEVTINPGYKGTSKIMLNGAEITNGKMVITPAMSETATSASSAVVLSAIGDITIDTGSTEPVEKDDGMGISDYLLIVLVILAAILVVIVAIRMMRS